MAIVGLVERLLAVCERVFHALANGCLAIMLVANMVNIASRAVFDLAIPWVFPWSVVLFVWLSFLSFFVIYRKGRDITIDFLVDRAGPWARTSSRFLVNFIVLSLMTVMLWHGPQILATQVGTIQMVGLQRYSMSVPLFISCALIFIDFFVDTIEAFRGVERRPHKNFENV